MVTCLCGCGQTAHHEFDFDNNQSDLVMRIPVTPEFVAYVQTLARRAEETGNPVFLERRVTMSMGSARTMVSTFR